MVKKLVLFDKIYNQTSEKKRKDIIIRFSKQLHEKTKGFHRTSVTIKKLREFDKRFEIVINGPEEIFLSNLIKKEIGVINEFKDIKVGKVYKGNMVDVGKQGFGIFVDCAILNPNVDVLINLHSFRNQLCAEKVLSLREIIRAYDFIDNFPIFVKIINIELDKNKLQGEIAKKTLDFFQKVLDENLEGVFISGETKGQFKKAIERNGHWGDIISIKRYGFLEHFALLKENTEAPGIIAHIGKNLRNCKLSAIRPERIKSLFY